MMKFFAIISMLVLASADSRRLKKGKGSKKQPQPPQPKPQCETLELYVLNYNTTCVKVKNPFEGRNQSVDNAIGWTDYEAIYGPPDKDGFFTDPPIGIKFYSIQDGPATPDQYDGEMFQYGWYKLAAGFMLDPTPTRFVAAPDTLYRSSIWYQDYYYAATDGITFYTANHMPIIGGSGRYACATGEITPKYQETTYDENPDCWGIFMFRLRICNTCPDPEEEYE